MIVGIARGQASGNMDQNQNAVTAREGVTLNEKNPV